MANKIGKHIAIYGKGGIGKSTTTSNISAALAEAVNFTRFVEELGGTVTGIEPKEKTLEGVEYLAGKGILSLTNAWNPNPGSKLEGHRTPSPEWHLDLAKKTYQIFKKAGFTYEQYFDVSPSADFLVHDIYRIEEERLPTFKQ